MSYPFFYYLFFPEVSSHCHLIAIGRPPAADTWDAWGWEGLRVRRPFSEKGLSFQEHQLSSRSIPFTGDLPSLRKRQFFDFSELMDGFVSQPHAPGCFARRSCRNWQATERCAQFWEKPTDCWKQLGRISRWTWTKAGTEGRYSSEVEALMMWSRFYLPDKRM